MIDRTFPGGPNFVSLTGTVDVPLGSYTMMNGDASPFTSVDLTLTVNGSSYSVDNVINQTYGTGQFLINATTTSLTFDVANVGGNNPASLVFTDDPSQPLYDRYGIGAASGSQFESATTRAGDRSLNDTVFPTEWGVAVPEPSSVSLLAIPLALLGFRVARARKQVA